MLTDKQRDAKMWFLLFLMYVLFKKQIIEILHPLVHTPEKQLGPGQAEASGTQTRPATGMAGPQALESQSPVASQDATLAGNWNQDLEPEREPGHSYHRMWESQAKSSPLHHTFTPPTVED